MAAGLADDAAERHRGSAGHRGSRDGGPLRRFPRQCGNRRELADLHRRDRIHHFVVHRHERAGVTLCRRRRRGKGGPHGLPGLPHRARHIAFHHGAGGLLRVAVPARPGECGPAGQGGGAALPANHVRLQPGHDGVLHAWRSTPFSGRRPNTDGAWHRGNTAERRAERGADSGPWSHSGIRHQGRSDRHLHVIGARVGVRAVQADSRGLGGVVPQRGELCAGLGDHQVALPLRPPDRHPGHRDEHRRRAHAVVHRIAGAERGGAGGVRRLVFAAVLVRDLDVGRPDGRSLSGRRAEPRRRPSGSRG